MSSQDNPITTLAQTDADFAAWLERWRVKHDETQARHQALYDQVQSRIDDETGKLVMRCEEARQEQQSLEWQLFAETAIRHFPGIAPALRLAWEHAMDVCAVDLTSCCSDGLVPW